MSQTWPQYRYTICTNTKCDGTEQSVRCTVCNVYVAHQFFLIITLQLLRAKCCLHFRVCTLGRPMSMVVNVSWQCCSSCSVLQPSRTKCVSNQFGFSHFHSPTHICSTYCWGFTSFYVRCLCLCLRLCVCKCIAFSQTFHRQCKAILNMVQVL